MTAAAPFLKWAGGKRQLLPKLLAMAPERIGTYYEPFLGGGALFFALANERRFERAKLSDVNNDVVMAYLAVRNDVDEVIYQLKQHTEKFSRHGAHYYRAVRELYNSEFMTGRAAASAFIFMNKVGYNGLCRYNRKGGFNVPCGKHASPPLICDEDGLRAASTVLQGIQLGTGDFQASVWSPGEGDFVYADPPYFPVKKASFREYTRWPFGPDEQLRLRDTAAEWSRLGASILLSNSDTPATRELYADQWDLTEVRCRRSVNSDGAGRGKVGELLIHRRP